MSILKKLFGGGGGNGTAANEAAAETVIAGVKVVATPMPEGGQFRLCAVLSKEIGGEVREHRLIRADLFASRDEAASAAFRKAERVIAEQGDALFG